MNGIKLVASAAALLFVAVAASAQAPVIYPAKGQSAAQQKKDDGECVPWAKQQAGVDPTRPLPAPQPVAQAPAPRGGVIRGAAVGATIGAIADNDVGDAAVKGAVVGGAKQRGKAQGQQQASAAQAQQSQMAHQEMISTYNRAYGACMSGRGYSVK